jgi:iron complex outermembrane receptor protein
MDENSNGIRDFDDVNNNGVYESGIDMWTENRRTEDKGNLTVGDAVVYGVDIQSTLLITERDKLDISVSYLKQYFTDLIFDYYDITNWLGLPDIDYSDKEMPSAPNWVANVNYSHNFSLPNGGTLTPRLEARYSSEYFLNFKAWDVGFGEDQVTGELVAYQIDTSGIRDQEAYYIADFSMTYASPDGNWTLSAYVKNMADYAVKRFMFFGNINIGPPRTYGAVLSVRF